METKRTCFQDIRAAGVGCWHKMAVLLPSPIPIPEMDRKTTTVLPKLTSKNPPRSATTEPQNPKLEMSTPPLARTKSQGGSRWCWLLAQDGTPASVNTKNTTTNTNTTAAVSPATKTSAGEITSNPLVCGSWHWLLAPDGSPAMVGKKTEDEEVENGTRSSSPVTKTTSEECKRRRGPMVQHSWHWLLAPDGSPATAEHSTLSRVATGGKRKRGGERHASGPKPRSYRRRTDAISAESFETDDEHSRINKHQHTQWKEKFELLVEYKNKHKTTRVPWKEPILGGWVADQRRIGRSGRLTKYRRECLGLSSTYSCLGGWRCIID